MQILKVPAIFGVYLPPDGGMPGQWLNLALIRELEIHDADAIWLTWDNGNRQPVVGKRAAALLSAWEEACEISRDRLREPNETKRESE